MSEKDQQETDKSYQNRLYPEDQQKVDEFIARNKIAEADGDTSFYQSKLMTAQFYFERLLPRTESLKKTMLSGADNLMQMPEELFAV